MSLRNWLISGNLIRVSGIWISPAFFSSPVSRVGTRDMLTTDVLRQCNASRGTLYSSDKYCTIPMIRATRAICKRPSNQSSLS